ncbi:MAG: alpha/beta hydrolase-fold protein [Caldilineales bacterium]|nr:alpha/beta hydrolase-fold protein [Caldilineales bacterium]
MTLSLPPRSFFYLGHAYEPTLEIRLDDGVLRLPMSWVGSGRSADEGIWVAELSSLPADGEWQFRLDLGDGRCEQPEFAPFYTTTLRRVWFQDHQAFGYRPAPVVSPPQVVKIPEFKGRLSPRPLYIYLPRGYDEHTEKRYPVLYMHDGQNCFEAFVDDSYAGSWQADITANLLIRQGLMRECIIVGVGNGQEQRILEYLPPYARHLPPPRRPTKPVTPEEAAEQPQRPLRPVSGRANHTAAYYREVAAYVEQTYRALPDRDARATCGSSMGGLLSVYLAWEHPDFARHHAALSPSFWITRNPDGSMEAVNRLRSLPRRDVRLWLDSGTRSTPTRGDDGMRDTQLARAALLAAGYDEGRDFVYYLDEGAIHSETAWAARLPLIFQFLFPTTDDDLL